MTKEECEVVRMAIDIALEALNSCSEDYNREGERYQHFDEDKVGAAKYLLNRITVFQK